MLQNLLRSRQPKRVGTPSRSAVHVAPILLTLGMVAGSVAAGSPPAGATPADAAPAGAAPAGAAPASTSLHFATLALINGWHAASKGAGAPGVAKGAGGIVYLRGALAGGRNFGAFTLPAADRPSHLLYMPVSTSHGAHGSIYVNTAGLTEVFGTNATTFSSLAGISFPAAGKTSLTFKTLPLLNGWHSEQSQYRTGAPAVARSASGVVHLEGSLAGGTNPTAFYLPNGDLSARPLWIAIYTLAGGVGTLYISPTGKAEVSGPGASAFGSLAGVSFPEIPSTALTFKAVSLMNGWKSENSVYWTGTPGAARSADGIVYLEGAVAGGSTTLPAFTVPASDRPTHTLLIPMSSGEDLLGTLEVKQNGDVRLFGPGAVLFSDLWGISFPTAS
jgi:hypothetical protein